jgi:hypothetical protein
LIINPSEDLINNLIELHEHLIKKIKRNCLQKQTVSLLIVLLCKLAITKPKVKAIHLKDIIGLYQSFLNDLKESSEIKCEEKYLYRIFLCSLCLDYLSCVHQENYVEVVKFSLE